MQFTTAVFDQLVSANLPPFSPQRCSRGWASQSSPSWFSAHTPTASLNSDLFESIWMGKKNYIGSTKAGSFPLRSVYSVCKTTMHVHFSEFPGSFHLSGSTFLHHLCLGSALCLANFPSASDATCPTPTQSLFFNLRMLKYFAILKHSES